ncbi:hypothetical protein F5887DRAFT_1080340 [Amanita rubescens]|nr:hypothetical protein F5887DRAFT_1080340 [Amanita rubescens]
MSSFTKEEDSALCSLVTELQGNNYRAWARQIMAYFQISNLMVFMCPVIPNAIPAHLKAVIALITSTNKAAIIIQADELVQNEKALHAIKLRLSYTIFELYQHVYNARLLWMFLQEHYKDDSQAILDRSLDKIDHDRSINKIITCYRHIAAQGPKIPTAHLKKALTTIRAVPLKWINQTAATSSVTANNTNYSSPTAVSSGNTASQVGPIRVQQLASEIHSAWSLWHHAIQKQCPLLTRDNNSHTEHCLANASLTNKGKGRCRCSPHPQPTHLHWEDFKNSSKPDYIRGGSPLLVQQPESDPESDFTHDSFKSCKSNVSMPLPLYESLTDSSDTRIENSQEEFYDAHEDFERHHGNFMAIESYDQWVEEQYSIGLDNFWRKYM